MFRRSIAMSLKEFSARSKTVWESSRKDTGAAGADLKGLLELRVGDYRVVFRIVKNEVWIFAIMHRRDVYQRIETRLSIQ